MQVDGFKLLFRLASYIVRLFQALSTVLFVRHGISLNLFDFGEPSESKVQSGRDFIDISKVFKYTGAIDVGLNIFSL